MNVIASAKDAICHRTLDRAPIVGQKQIRRGFAYQVSHLEQTTRQAVLCKRQAAELHIDVRCNPFAGIEARIKRDNGMAKSMWQRIDDFADPDRYTPETEAREDMQEVTGICPKLAGLQHDVTILGRPFCATIMCIIVAAFIGYSIAMNRPRNKP
jgi:hypothetical protein